MFTGANARDYATREYLAYVSFFPQLVAGPIERATHCCRNSFGRAASTTTGRWMAVAKCCGASSRRWLSPITSRPLSKGVFGDPRRLQLPGNSRSSTVLFAVQIYCDFSAYSEIASGLARLFGFELIAQTSPQPYFSQSLGEFWRRWHISLTSWFKDYVYLPWAGVGFRSCASLGMCSSLSF
jgi:D-alanyl-lipoteichoic acid acyltransferase DltB (MBOAT superfamily)